MWRRIRSIFFHHKTCYMTPWCWHLVQMSSPISLTWLVDKCDSRRGENEVASTVTKLYPAWVEMVTFPQISRCRVQKCLRHEIPNPTPYPLYIKVRACHKMTHLSWGMHCSCSSSWNHSREECLRGMQTYWKAQSLAGKQCSRSFSNSSA